MGNKSLKWKIVRSVSLLLIALIAATLVYVGYQADGFVDGQLAAELARTEQAIVLTEEQRLSGLGLSSGLVANFSDLKALLETDAATIRDFLDSYLQSNQNADLLIVLDPTGSVLARTDALNLSPVENVESKWIQPILSGRNAAGILQTPSGTYHATARPATAGGLIFCVVIAGSRIDDAFAASLRQNAQDEIVILGDGVIATTLPANALPWGNRQDLDGTPGIEPFVDIAGERYTARPVRTVATDEVEALAIILRSVDRAMVPYRNIQIGLLILGLLTTGAGVGGSIVLARGITAPVARLVEGTRQVAEGNFEYHLDIQSKDEIGDLSESFNQMVQGLRERKDMQRFVSESTVEMIQTQTSRTREGERVRQTIFFSDIRGFTKMSEEQPPEETIRILNRCLSLQAELVKTYHGDVDKFVGDSVVAVFAGDDMALNAIRCAVDIQKALDEDNIEHPEAPSLRVGIGIVTGEIIMGSIGSSDRRDFTVVGSNVNLCSRLCGAAGPHEILLSEETYQLVKDLVAAQAEEPISVKGFSNPVPVYRMIIS